MRRDARRGLPRRSLSVLVGLLFSPVAYAVVGVQVARFEADVPFDNDYFGSSVALDSGVALIGARFSPRSLIDDIDVDSVSGAAFVFNTSTGELTDTITLEDYNFSFVGRFGANVAMADGVAVVGNAYRGIGGWFSSGAAIYDVASQAPDGVLDDPTTVGFLAAFGGAVAIHGDVALISAPESNGIPNPDSIITGGSAYLYRVSDGSLLRDLSPASTPRYLRYGASVALNDDFAVVSNVTLPTLYVFDPSTGEQLHEIDLSALADIDPVDDWLPVDIDGHLAVVGANTADEAYLFDLRSGDLLHTLRPDSGPGPSFFGQSVAIDDGIVTVGALRDNEGNPTGSVYVFDASTGDQLTRLVPEFDPSTFQPDLFGWSVDIDAGAVLVGAARSPESTQPGGSFGPGSAYLFRLVPEPSAAVLLAMIAAFSAGRPTSR